MKLSICIPNYNRVRCLKNCLNSIYIAYKTFNFNFEICISDNNSEENVDEVINHYKEILPIKFNKFDKNYGLGVNILKSVNLAEGEFSWIIGNDDLLLPETFQKLDKIFKQYEDVDYFFINSYHLSSQFVFNQTQPFNTKFIPSNLKKFSDYGKNLHCDYFDLIDYKIAFDFLLGQFLSIFRTKMWNNNLDAINYDLIYDDKVMSNIYNTFSHNIIFAKAFSNSKAFFNHEPLSINLYGERDWWKAEYEFVLSVRIPELLEIYRKNGLNYFQYLLNKNFALRRLFIFLIKLIFFKNVTGWKYLSIKNHILKNLFFPSIYIMPFFYLVRKIFNIIFFKKRD